MFVFELSQQKHSQIFIMNESEAFDFCPNVEPQDQAATSLFFYLCEDVLRRGFTVCLPAELCLSSSFCYLLEVALVSSWGLKALYNLAPPAGAGQVTSSESHERPGWPRPQRMCFLLLLSSRCSGGVFIHSHWNFSEKPFILVLQLKNRFTLKGSKNTDTDKRVRAPAPQSEQAN